MEKYIIALYTIKSQLLKSKSYFTSKIQLQTAFTCGAYSVRDMAIKDPQITLEQFAKILKTLEKIYYEINL